MEGACGDMMKGKEGACGMMPMPAGEKGKEVSGGAGMKMPEAGIKTPKPATATSDVSKPTGVKVIPAK